MGNKSFRYQGPGDVDSLKTVLAMVLVMCDDAITAHGVHVGDGKRGDTLVLGTASMMPEGRLAGGSTKFMVRMNPEMLALTVFAWLDTANYPSDPDIDGSVKRGGVTIELTDWGRTIEVRPAWKEYHK